jgi:short-subunit dehydrogenase
LAYDPGVRDLNGRSVLLTGATGGIGKAIARALHARGAHLVVTGRRPEVLDELASELAERVKAAPADLASPDDVRRLVEQAGEVDVLVANAALPASGRLESFSSEELDRSLDVNLRTPMHLTRALAPGMVERGRGHLVYISSLSAKVVSGGGAIYSATKAGLRAFALGVRDDLHGTGVGVTTVFPGFISDAGMWAEAGLKLPPGVGTRTPEQVANAVVRGIERNRPEIDVAPPGLRVAGKLGGVAPAAIAAVMRRAGSEDLSRALAEAQRSKR